MKTFTTSLITELRTLMSAVNISAAGVETSILGKEWDIIAIEFNDLQKQDCILVTIQSTIDGRIHILEVFAEDIIVEDGVPGSSSLSPLAAYIWLMVTEFVSTRELKGTSSRISDNGEQSLSPPKGLRFVDIYTYEKLKQKKNN